MHALSVREADRVFVNIDSPHCRPFVTCVMFISYVFLPDLVILSVAAPGSVQRLQNLNRQHYKSGPNNITHYTKNTNIVPVAKKVVHRENIAKNGI